MEVSWMANHRVGETGLSDTGPSSQPPMAYGTNGITLSAASFFDQEGTNYFGELEVALMHGVVGKRNDIEERKCLPSSKVVVSGDNHEAFFTSTRPPTLEIFPSWPMRSHQAHKGHYTEPAEEDSTDSGSAQNTLSQLDSESPASRKASSEQSGEQQGMMNMANEAPPSYHPTAQEKRKVAASTSDKDGKILDAKTLRRLAQNREAARKSRMRKKAYVQQLETSRMRLSQLEQDLQRARSQGLLLAGSSGSASLSSGAAMFDMEYSRWLDDNYKHMTELRRGLQAHLPDGDLRVILDECLTHYDEIFRLKSAAAKSDVFHLITGMWMTPAEWCFLWMGGFRPSELLKILIPQVDPLTENQLLGICNLQQSSQQAEEALSQGLEQLHQSLADTVAGGTSTLITEASGAGSYMGHMVVALGKLANLEGFVRQADNLRQETLHQMCRILTIRQAARCFLAIGEYYSRLRALSSLWASRPRENMVNDEGSCPTAPADLQQIIQQPSAAQGHFSAF